jgi:rhodanese-related sulfurtransferase
MKPISREEVKQKWQREEPFTFVEVLSHDVYKDFHLPNALNVPLNEDFEDRIQQAVPDKNQEVIVYCKNKDCTASPTAAKKIDQLGYRHVYDYEAGKEDWKAAGLPIETL